MSGGLGGHSILLESQTTTIDKSNSKIVTYVPVNPPSPPSPVPTPRTPPTPTPGSTPHTYPNTTAPPPAPSPAGGKPWAIYYNHTTNKNGTNPIISPGHWNQYVIPVSIIESLPWTSVVCYELFQNGSFQTLNQNSSVNYYPLEDANSTSLAMNWVFNPVS